MTNSSKQKASDAQLRDCTTDRWTTHLKGITSTLYELDLSQAVKNNDNRQSKGCNSEMTHMELEDEILQAFVITRAAYEKENIHVMNKHINLWKTEILIKWTKWKF